MDESITQILQEITILGPEQIVCRLLDHLDNGVDNGRLRIALAKAYKQFGSASQSREFLKTIVEPDLLLESREMLNSLYPSKSIEIPKATSLPKSPISPTGPRVICTAASAWYFPQLINLIGSLHKHCLQHIGKIVVYDLGMLPQQVDYLSGLAGVKVKMAPRFAPHAMSWSAWKGWVLRDCAENETDGAMLYLDAGNEVRSDLSNIFNMIECQGYLLFDCGSQLNRDGASDIVYQHFDLDRATDTSLLIHSGIQGYASRGAARYSIVDAAWDCFQNERLLRPHSDCLNNRQGQSIFSLLAYQTSLILTPQDSLVARINDSDKAHEQADIQISDGVNVCNNHAYLCGKARKGLSIKRTPTPASTAVVHETRDDKILAITSGTEIAAEQKNQKKFDLAKGKKIIALIPIKNEAARIAFCLRAAACYADAICVFDDGSTDSSVDIVESLATECRVERILKSTDTQLNETGYRQLLLEAGREIGGTHFIVVNADEAFTSDFRKDEGLRQILYSLRPGDQLAMPHLHLWRSDKEFRHDNSSWTNNVKACAFADDGVCCYSAQDLNMSRIPSNIRGQYYPFDGIKLGLLHFRFVNWENAVIKQAWRRCLEHINNPQKSLVEINTLYGQDLQENNLGTAPAPAEWLEGYEFYDPTIWNKLDNWRQEQVLNWFHEYGEVFFDGLDNHDVNWKGIPDDQFKANAVSAIASRNNKQMCIQNSHIADYAPRELLTELKSENSEKILINNQLNNNLSSYNQAPVCTSGMQEILKQNILQYTRQGDWKKSHEKAVAYLHDYPGDWEVVNAQSINLLKMNEVELAKSLMRDAIANAPNKRDFLHNLAFVLMEEGNLAEALDNAIKAYELDPASSETHRTLERIHRALKREVRQIRKKQVGAAFKDTPGSLKEHIKRAEIALGCIETAKQRMPRLSVVMIAKDEEERLPACLKSVQGIADEIIVVDTGSKDRTMEIARQFGAVVIEHPWQNDFSDARNVSLKHATGDWALWMDADEQLDPDQNELIRKLINNAGVDTGGFMTNIRNIMGTMENADIFWHRACRLFRLIPGLQFEGRIHEQNMKSLKSHGYSFVDSDLKLYHEGYLNEVMDSRDKHTRFITMLEREVNENLIPELLNFQTYNLANAYFIVRDFEKANEWFPRAAASVEANEEFASTLFVTWCSSLFYLKQYDEVLDACELARKKSITHPGIDFISGHVSLVKGELESAERCFKVALALGRETRYLQLGDSSVCNYKPLFGISMVRFSQKRYEESLDISDQVLVQKPNFAEAHFLRGCSLKELGRIEEAAAAFSSAVEMDPLHPAAWMDLALILFDKQDYLAATPALRRATELNPDDFGLWCKLAATLETQSNLDEAIKAYEHALKLKPNAWDLIINMGRAFVTMGQMAEALNCFTDVITHTPENANAYFNAADVLYKLGHYVKAAETLGEGLARDPLNASGFFVLGNCFFQLRDYSTALAAYRQALGLKPDYVEARNNLELIEQMVTEMANAA